jgi:hypothetical protein
MLAAAPPYFDEVNCTAMRWLLIQLSLACLAVFSIKFTGARSLRSHFENRKRTSGNEDTYSCVLKVYGVVTGEIFYARFFHSTAMGICCDTKNLFG